MTFGSAVEGERRRSRSPARVNDQDEVPLANLPQEPIVTYVYEVLDHSTMEQVVPKFMKVSQLDLREFLYCLIERGVDLWTKYIICDGHVWYKQLDDLPKKLPITKMVVKEGWIANLTTIELVDIKMRYGNMFADTIPCICYHCGIRRPVFRRPPAESVTQSPEDKVWWSSPCMLCSREPVHETEANVDNYRARVPAAYTAFRELWMATWSIWVPMGIAVCPYDGWLQPRDLDDVLEDA